MLAFACLLVDIDERRSDGHGRGRPLLQNFRRYSGR